MVPVSFDPNVTAFATRMEKKNEVTMVGKSEAGKIDASDISKSNCPNKATLAVMDVLRAKWLIERLGRGR